MRVALFIALSDKSYLPWSASTLLSVAYASPFGDSLMTCLYLRSATTEGVGCQQPRCRCCCCQRHVHHSKALTVRLVSLLTRQAAFGLPSRARRPDARSPLPPSWSAPAHTAGLRHVTRGWTAPRCRERCTLLFCSSRRSQRGCVYGPSYDSLVAKAMCMASKSLVRVARIVNSFGCCQTNLAGINIQRTHGVVAFI